MHAQTRARQRLLAIAFACGGAFSFAGNAHLGTPRTKCANIGRILPTSFFSPSLYFNTSHCAILRFAFCVFLLRVRRVQNRCAARDGAGAVLIDAQKLPGKKLPKLAPEQHVTTGKSSARAGHGSGARNTKTARTKWRGLRRLRASRSWYETVSDPCGSEDPQGYLGQ